MSSTVPAALDALVAMATDAFAADTKVQIVDGPPLQVAPDFVAIGFNGDPEGDAVTLDFSNADAGLSQAQESYTIACLIGSWNGDRDLSVARRRAFDLLGTFRAAIEGDRTLRRTVATARLANGSLVHDPAEKGAAATIPVYIAVGAWSR